VELDDSSNHTDRRMLLLWPSKAYEQGRRYIIGVRGLVNSRNQPIQPSQAFVDLRDNITTTNPDIELRRALFADIFTRLNAVGWQQSTLQLAWDFTVGTQDSITGKLTFMRDDGLSRTTKAGGVKWRVESVEDNINPQIARHLEVSVQVPQYVNRNYPGATLVLDANGTPVYQGWAWNEVTILIPNIVANGTLPYANVVQYGHGLFGSRTEVIHDYLMTPADQYGNILIATDWLGLCEYDAPVVYDIMLTDLTKFPTVPDRCQQGVLLAYTAMRLLKEGNFAKDPNMVFNGKQILSDKSQYFYTGNSQGGILGAVYMAASVDVTRGVLGVGGGPYSLLCPRSSDFAILFDVLKERYTQDPLDRMGAIMTIQQLWDRAEPSGYMNYLTNRTLPNTPAHHVIMQHGLGDAQVTYVGAYSVMRSANAVMYSSNVNEPGENLYGFPFINDTAIATDAAIVTWDFPGIAPVPEENIPPPVGDTHEYVRRQNTSQLMMYNFFATGQIKNTCGGPCHGYIP
jgi:hypothetical protein